MMRGADTASKIEVSPRLGALLTQVTEVPDLEAALWKVLSEYIDLKIAYMQRQIQEFESKWNMTFAEFAERCEAGTLDEDSHSYDVESDYWEWEATVTLLRHYESLQA
jgi:hypothetical protein